MKTKMKTGMKGLLRNNVYAVLANAKVFALVMALLGIFVVIMDNRIPSLIIGYMLSATIGFPLCSIVSARKESASKWDRYKLTLPVKRADIVKSCFLSQLLWQLVGMAFAGTGAALSVALHGYPFDKNTDVFMLFVVGIGISLFMGAVFFPLLFWGGTERSEAFSVVSLLCGAGIIMGLITFINTIFPARMTVFQIILAGILILACGALAFGLSCPLTVGIFRRKEY